MQFSKASLKVKKKNHYRNKIAIISHNIVYD